MKKVLFATTALVATAGMAAAEVSFGGYGRFGLFYDEGAVEETRIEQRFRLTITGSTTADNGVEFEGRIRLQTDENSDGASSAAKTSAAGFAVTSGGFRLDVGHVSDVLDSGDVMNYYGYGVGLTSFLEQSNGQLPGIASGFGTSADNLDTTAPTIKLRYTVGDFTVAASYTDDADLIRVNPATNPLTTVLPGNSEYQIGFGYSFGNYSAGIAFGSRETLGGAGPDNDFWALGFDGEFGAFAFSILVGDSDVQASTSYGFSVNYAVGAATDLRFVYNDNGAAGNSDQYGIGVRHSLGGGVTLAGGIGDLNGNTVADLGVIFNF